MRHTKPGSAACFPPDRSFSSFTFTEQISDNQGLLKAILLSGEGNGTPLQYSRLENLRTEEPGRLQDSFITLKTKVGT